MGEILIYILTISKGLDEPLGISDNQLLDKEKDDNWLTQR